MRACKSVRCLPRALCGDEEVRGEAFRVDDVPAVDRRARRIEQPLRDLDETLHPPGDARVLVSGSVVELEARQAFVEPGAQRVFRHEQRRVLGNGHRMEVGHELRRALQVAGAQVVEVELVARAEALHEHAVFGRAFRAVDEQRHRSAATLLESREGSMLVGHLVVVERLLDEVHAQHVALPGRRVRKPVVLVVLPAPEGMRLEERPLRDAKCLEKPVVPREVRCRPLESVHVSPAVSI